MSKATTAPVRIAMWSGPRNVSTALMRSFASRADTSVCDEPLYAHYLKQTGLGHPLAAEVMRSQPTDWRRVAAALTGPVPDGRAIFFQKHMAHHLLPSVGRRWLGGLSHAFLIRQPDQMLTSLTRVLDAPTLHDTGLPQQVALYDELVAAGDSPPVMDGADLLADPPAMLATLCARLGIPWDAAMLSWEPGLQASDGVWAPAWYDAVAASTGFSPPRPTELSLSADLTDLHQRCLPLYAHLAAQRLTT